VGSAADAVDQIQSLIAKHHARRLVIGRGPVIDSLALDQVFRGKSGDVWIEPADLNNVNEADLKKRLFAAEIGITGVDWLIAETGSLVLYSGRGRARSLSLLPPVHIAVAHASQILADLFDLHLAEVMPSCVSLITGPSKTGDIELQLVTGVHGPGEVHVVLLTNDR
jgi:L-lactate dehydrogenase complex protein LldG